MVEYAFKHSLIVLESNYKSVKECDFYIVLLSIQEEDRRSGDTDTNIAKSLRQVNFTPETTKTVSFSLVSGSLAIIFGRLGDFVSTKKANFTILQLNNNIGPPATKEVD